MSANGVQSRAASQGEADIEARLPGPAVPPASEAPSASADMLLNFCRAFNCITIICSLMCAVALGIGISVHLHDPDQGLYSIAGQIVRAYGLLWAVLLIFVELELTSLAAWWPLLESWIGRAFFQSFVAVLTYREAIGKGEADIHESLLLYRALASGALLCCAGIYALGWVLCLGVIKEMRLKRSQNLQQAREEYLSLDKRRAELEKLLGREPAI